MQQSKVQFKISFDPRRMHPGWKEFLTTIPPYPDIIVVGLRNAHCSRQLPESACEKPCDS